jgi:ADP-heptose:LPS heptosyltransferase
VSGERRATGHTLDTHVLIDLPNWLGDQVMALPAVHRVLAANRSGRTVLHTRPATERFLRVLFPDAEVAASQPKAFPLTTAGRLRRRWGVAAVGITLRNAYRAKIMLALAARRTYGSNGQGARLLLTHSVPVDRRRHQVHDLDPVLRALGVGEVDARWRPVVRSGLVEEGRERLRAAGIGDGPVVALAPATASGSAKRWPVGHFAALADRCAGGGIAPVVVIGPGERALAESIAAAATRPVPVLGEDLDVAGLAGILAAVAVAVSVDSGAMHVAAILGTPVVALFGPTAQRRTGPLGARHRVLGLHLDCAPCAAADCPLGHRRCMRELAVDEVEGAVLEVLG